MSTIMKFFVMAIVWLVFSFLAFNTCIKPEYCPDDGANAAAAAPVDEPAAAITNDYAIVSSLGSNDVLTGSRWAALRDKLVGEYGANPNQALDVYGHYYASEAKPADFENMGFLRAEEIKQILLRETNIPGDKINTLARLMDGSPDADPWRAGTFNWQAIEEEPVESAVIELDKNEIDILFPFSSSTKEVDPSVDAYLVKLAQRLQQTNETVVLTGHTDDVSSDEYNMGLGQRRADFVKNILVRNGAPANRITTRSRGESDPRRPNTTDANRRQNRRVNVKLSAQ
ncbi:OmpA family protein [Neolewinella agarilytica]|nr:OmpA family protein [Neolewinella agarilytica]